MSEIKKVDENQVAEIINRFLADEKIKLSKQNVDTYYLCGHDRQNLLSLTRDIAPGSEATYSITLNCISSQSKFDKDFAKKMYQFIDMDKIKYNPIKITSTQAKKQWDDKYAHAPMKDKEKFLHELIGKGMVYYIRRTFYYFDGPKKQKKNSVPFPMFQHDAKLVMYEGPLDVVWFYTDDKHSSGFKSFDPTKFKMFNVVKIALQNQKQNVK